MHKTSNTRHELANKMQSIPAEQIKQAVIRWLDTEDAGLNELSQNLDSALEQESSLCRSPLSTEEKIAAFNEWVESHRGKNLPLLSDEEISRESMYPDRF